MGDLPSEKKKKRGGKINFYGYIPAEMYDAIAPYRDPDAGDRWESALLRRIIREWLVVQELRGAGAGTQQPAEKEPGRLIPGPPLVVKRQAKPVKRA